MIAPPAGPPAHPLRPSVALIAAVARNGAIGAGNRLLWHEPEDRRHFRETTFGCPVIMGRKTWESLPVRFRPLPGRRNLVLSTNAHWQENGAERFDSLAAALGGIDGGAVPSVFVIGGAQVYALALPLADSLNLTEIDADLPGDVFFPHWDSTCFQIEHASDLRRAADGTGYRFVSYRRRC